MNAYIYLRKSRDKAELADPDILGKHRRALLRAAEQDGVTIPTANIFEEIGSGEYIASRPVFQRLLGVLAQIPKLSGGRLYVMDIDRLSRGAQSERALVQEQLSHAGILVRTAGGAAIDLGDPDQRLLYQVKGDLAENELGKYKARVQAAWADMLREGRVRNGMVPFGWAWDYKAKRPVPDPERFPIVLSLLQDAFTLSIEDLAERYGLNENKVRQLIRNPFVCGYPARRWRKTSKEKRGAALMPKDQWVWPEQAGGYPAAITLAEWERLQAAIDQRTKARDTYRSNAGWCRDVVRFAGGPDQPPILGTHTYPGHRTETYELTPPGAKRLYVARAVIHAAATAALQPVLTDATLLAAIQREASAMSARDRDRLRSTRGAKAKAIAPLRLKLDDLLVREMEAEDDEERASIGRVRAAIRQEIAALGRDREVCAAPMIPQADTVLPIWQALTEDWESCWSILTDRQKRALVRAVLACILVEISKEPGKRAHRREVTAVRYQPWVEKAV